MPVKVILLPQGTWMGELPFATYYDTRVRTLCGRTGTPLLDWSAAMADADFIDSNHLTIAGQTRFRAMLFAAERERLGAAPTGDLPRR